MQSKLKLQRVESARLLHIDKLANAGLEKKERKQKSEKKRKQAKKDLPKDETACIKKRWVTRCRRTCRRRPGNLRQ